MFALLDGPTVDQLGVLIPIVALFVTLGIAIAVSIAVAHVKARRIEAERDMLARRLAYDQRLKELEIERLRLTGGAGPAAAHGGPGERP